MRAIKCSICMFGIGLWGCNPIENTVEKIETTDVDFPSLVVEPNELNFGIIEPTDSVTESVTITNKGGIALEIFDVAIEGMSFTAASSAPIGLVQPDESVTMSITYSPLNLDDNGWLTISSDDPLNPETYVPLMGQGAIPLLVIEPNPLDIGWADIDEIVTDGFTLRNDGAADLTVSQALLVGDEFDLADTSFLPVTLTPGEEFELPVDYGPRVYGEHFGTLWVQSDTPAGTSQASVEGACAPKPQAVCSVDPAEIAPHYETATWIGEDSFDPSGGEITEYEWTLVTRPEGSTSYISNGGPNRPNFSPDLAGTYVGQLVVYNEWGRASDPCEATLEAIPRESLWVELYWEHDSDDMDLHIVRPNGSLETDGDCYYWNCVSGGWLDWGVIGFADDDPSLDIDDITGTGPENTNILFPENGVFEIWVHDFPGSVFTPANTVYVRIYLSGELAWEGSQVISGENSYTRFAQVVWPDAEIIPD